MNGLKYLWNSLTLDFETIAFDILILLIALASTFFLNSFLNKKKSEKNWYIPKGFLFALIWLIALIFSAIISFSEFQNTIIFKNYTFKITAFNLAVIIILINANLFLVRFIKLQSIKKLGILKNKSLRIIVDIILWLITLHFTAKLTLINYNKIVQKELFSLYKVPITIYDIFFILLTIAITITGILSIELFFNRLINLNKINKSAGFALYKIIKYFLWVFVILFILQSLGFNISLLLASSAALLVGLGMGIQEVFGDVFSGFVILFERQINVGDIVEVNGLIGKILDIGFRTTTIITRDDIKIIVPNSKLTNENVINWTQGKPLTRFSVSVGVAYGSDVQLVEKLLLKAASETEKVVSYPPPVVIFSEFGESSLDFKVYFYTADSFNVEIIQSNIRKKIDSLFRSHNISIPFPQRDIHIIKNQ